MKGLIVYGLVPFLILLGSLMITYYKEIAAYIAGLESLDFLFVLVEFSVVAAIFAFLSFDKKTKNHA